MATFSLTMVAIGSALLSQVKKMGKAVAIGGILIAAFALLPISISLPSFIYGLLVGNNFYDVLYLVGYIMPVDFIVQCILMLLFTKYFDIIAALVSTIAGWVKSIVTHMT